MGESRADYSVAAAVAAMAVLEAAESAANMDEAAIKEVQATAAVAVVGKVVIETETPVALGEGMAVDTKNCSTAGQQTGPARCELSHRSPKR